MDLTLKKQTHSCFDAAPTLCEKRELSAETIVPDYCPDISRIVDTSGCLLIDRKEASDGRIYVSGKVRMSLFYMAEGGSLKSINYSLPIEEYFENRNAPSFRDFSVEASLGCPEVRLLNPRKVSTRIAVVFRLTPYCENTLGSCCEIEQEESCSIHTLVENHASCITKYVKEKDFTFIENIAPSSSKEDIQEILCSQTQLQLSETKYAGGKVFLRGTVLSDIVCCLKNGELYKEHSELPFAQILDVGAGDEELSARASLQLMDCEYHIGSEADPEDKRTICIKLRISAFITLCQDISLKSIADLYSTSYELKCESESIELCREKRTLTKDQSVREQFEIGTEVTDILKCDVIFTQASLTMQEGSAQVRANAVIKVLYLDEGGVPFSAERRCDISSKCDLPENCTATLESVCCGELHAIPMHGGIELRFSVLFNLSTECRCRYMTLKSLQAQERSEKTEKMPSLIVKPVKRGQKLWDLAKEYRTTVANISAANDLEGEILSNDEVLLIPRKR